MQKTAVDSENSSKQAAGAALLSGDALQSEKEWRRALKRFLRNPTNTLGAILIILFILAAFFPVALLPHDPYKTDIRNRFLPPVWAEEGSTEFPLGTDALGRDNLSMIIHGARYSFLIIVLSASISLVLGVSIGLMAGYFGGRLDDIVMRLADIQLAFPILVLIIAIVAILGPNLRNLVIVIGITGWAAYARLIRGLVLSIREREFFEAARAAGANDWRIMSRHLLPNAITPIVIFASFDLARLLLAESALAFLGLGVQPPTPSWGAMIADGRQHMFEAWWTSALPGLAIVLSVMAFNLLGDGLRDALDPTSYRS